MGSASLTTLAMATYNNFGGQSFSRARNSNTNALWCNGGNRFESQRFNGSTGVEASFRAQVPDFLRNDPDVIGMVAAINREETNFNRLKKEVEMRGRNLKN